MSNSAGGGIADDGSNVVFLLSSPRAGSTLLSAILNRHSRVLCPAEPWFLLSLNALYHGTSTGVAAYEQRIADIGLRELAGEDEFLQAARAFASSLYSSRLAATGHSVFVDKTPRYYHILPFLHALFPGARMIWLKRNPLDVAASYKTSWNVPVAELAGRVLSPSSFDLTLGLLNFGAWFDGSPGRLEISYEKLVADPDGVVEQVLGFLGLEAESSLSDYGANTEAMNAFRRSSLGDRKVLEHTRPHRRSVGQWRELFSTGELTELLSGIGTDSFIRMGYEDVLAEAAAKAGMRIAAESKTPRHLDKLRLYQRWFAAALPAEKTERDSAPRKPGALEGVLDLRIAALEAQLAVAEADRVARLVVIQKQGPELGRIPSLEAERDELIARLTGCEADRAARLAVIQSQGVEIGRMSKLVADRDALVAQRDALATQRDILMTGRDALAVELVLLRSTLEDIRSRAEGIRPKTLLGLAPPSEVRRLVEILSVISALTRLHTEHS